MLCPAHLWAWDGYDYDTGNHIEMENPVKPGVDIEIHDYHDETWHYVNVHIKKQLGDSHFNFLSRVIGLFQTSPLRELKCRVVTNL